ncbi:hypothetical protein [Dethiosulfatarculus sandiegensis]|nr:hypothetical protein [Dethiosulfatarculus sandiegensis]
MASEVMDKIREYMKSEGIPIQDGPPLPSSEKSFPDGAHWRIEIAGVERASTMEAMIKEADRRGVVVHRAIATVGGSTYCDFQELKDMATMANEAKIELVTVVGHRKAWDVGAREISNPEGAMQGFRLRGQNNIVYHLADMMRNIEAGHRGFLVFDEGVLKIACGMRAKGIIPTETIFKFSVFGGYCSAAGGQIIEQIGVDSINPLSDVSLGILSSMREGLNVPLDVYTIIVDAFGGMYRVYEAPEMARVAAPIYFKIEPGTSEGDIYKPWAFESFHQELVREKVKMAEVICETMDKHAPELKTSPAGPADLSLPVV